MVGTAAYRYRLCEVAVLVTRSSTSTRMAAVPALWAGTLIVHVVVLLQEAATVLEPTSAMSAPRTGRKPVPVRVTVVPPLTGPAPGRRRVTVGLTFLVA